MVQDPQTTLSPHSLYIYIKWGINFVCLFVFSVNYLKSKWISLLRTRNNVTQPNRQRFAQSVLTGEARTTSQKPSNLTLRSIYYLVPLSFVFIYMCPAPFSTHKKDYPQKCVLQSSNSKNKAKNTMTGKNNVQCS